MKTYQVGPKVKGHIKETLNLHIKVVPPKEKKRKTPSPPILEAEKWPRMTTALLEKKIEDLSDVIYTLEKRIDEEHVYRKSLQHDLNALNHFVAKMKKWELGS